MDRKMVTKEESPMEKEWSRWNTSFSSVPAFTHWERDTVDYRGARETDRKWEGPLPPGETATEWVASLL